MLKSIRACAAAASIALGAVAPAAAELAAPQGEILLTVSGGIGQTNMAGTAAFDRAMLEAMDAVEIATSTIWTDGVQDFVGVSLADIIAVVEADGGSLMATAINDYAVEIPLSDAVENGPIVAYLRNGEEMSVRDKGPLWIIYPYDQNVDYQSEVIYSRSIWQLDRIEVVD